MESTELDFRSELDRLTGQLQAALAEVIGTIDDRIALPPGAQEALAGFHQPLPDNGCGAAAAIEEADRA
ncbi:MAG: hypothetical protein U5Q16_16090 [Gammaproteobacteria bacterium]|nr:hypothetical protein [Gammaproteobacteria bacterium]